jgi:hypothetical protein
MDLCISAMFLVVVSFGTLSLFLCACGGLKSTARPKSGKPVHLTDKIDWSELTRVYGDDPKRARWSYEKTYKVE